MWSSLRNFYHFCRIFGINNRKEIGSLVAGGVLMSFLEFLGISAIFPLLLLILQPKEALQSGLLQEL